MAFETTENPFGAVFGLIERKLDHDAAAKRQAADNAAFTGGGALYGVDEFGRAFLRGAPSSSMPAGVVGASPGAFALAALLALALLYYALKR